MFEHLEQQKKDYIRYMFLGKWVNRRIIYSTLTTSGLSYLQRIKIKGLDNAIK